MNLSAQTTKTVLATVLSCIFLLFSFASELFAQPNPGQLAERLEQAYQERIANINQLEVTTLIRGGLFEGMESTTRFEKLNRDGRYQLVEADADEMYGGLFEGIFDDVLPEMVRNASSITDDSFEGSAVYRIYVDDQEFLRQLDSGEAMVDEELAGEFHIESATIWLDSRDLVVRHLTLCQTGEQGEEIAVHFTMSDYRTHSGMPIPHRMKFDLEGVEQFISEEQIAEARAGMRELEEQLAQMPEAQRQMIEEQLRPQIEQFEAMLEEENPGSAEIEVTNVVVH